MSLEVLINWTVKWHYFPNNNFWLLIYTSICVDLSFAPNEMVKKGRELWRICPESGPFPTITTMIAPLPVTQTYMTTNDRIFTMLLYNPQKREQWLWLFFNWQNTCTEYTKTKTQNVFTPWLKYKFLLWWTHKNTKQKGFFCLCILFGN